MFPYADHDDDNDDDIVTRAVGQEKERRPVFISKRLPGASTLPRRGRWKIGFFFFTFFLFTNFALLQITRLSVSRINSWVALTSLVLPSRISTYFHKGSHPYRNSREAMDQRSKKSKLNAKKLSGQSAKIIYVTNASKKCVIRFRDINIIMFLQQSFSNSVNLKTSCFDFMILLTFSPFTQMMMIVIMMIIASYHDDHRIVH